MSRTFISANRGFFLIPAAFCCPALPFSRDKPGRPPWAQKPKTNSNSKSSAGSTSTTAPSTAPDGEPGNIAHPTAADPVEDTQDPAAQRGRIKVNVNLVNVLVSVLDEKHRPAPDLPMEA